MKKINFYSGPAILPEEVLLQAQEGIKDFAGTGLSILEISHRSKEFVRVMDETVALVKELMQLNEDREVLFLRLHRDPLRLNRQAFLRCSIFQNLFFLQNKSSGRREAFPFRSASRA